MLSSLSKINTHFAQEKNQLKRFNVIADLTLYPQDTPKKIAASVLKALEKERFDYITAHLLDPEFIDRRIKSTASTADQLIEEIKSHFTKEPDLLKALKTILRSGEITDDGQKASIKHKDYPNTQIFLRRIEDRWFIENRKEAERAPEKE